MLKASWLKLLPGYLMCALAFFIPFPFIFSSIAVIVLVFGWVLQINGREFTTNLKNRPLLWAWLGFYLLHALSYFYSANKEQSLFDLQVKLSLLAFPLVVGTANTTRWQVQRIFYAFVAGVTTVGIFYIGRALKLLVETGDSSHFFYHSLVAGFDAHAVYMAWYTLVAISALLFLPVTSARWKWVRIAVIIFCTIFFILLSSRTLILILLFFIAPLYLFRNIKRLPKPAIITSIIAFAALVVALFATNNPIKSRYDSIVNNDLHNAWLDDYSNVDESRFSNLTVRVFVWRMGYENLKEGNQWFTGVGNGDAKDVQNEKMREYGIRHLSEEFADNMSGFYNLNLHNMFVQSLVMVGIPGLILLLIMILSPFFHISFLKRNLIFLVFHIVSFIFMMQEAGLQSQAGVMFYGFFSMLYLSYRYTSKQTKFI